MSDEPAGYGLHDLWPLKSTRYTQDELCELVTQTVRTWADQCGLTLEQWFQVYELSVDAKAGSKPGAVVLVVTGRPREMPFSFEVTI